MFLVKPRFTREIINYYSKETLAPTYVRGRRFACGESRLRPFSAPNSIFPNKSYKHRLPTVMFMPDLALRKVER